MDEKITVYKLNLPGRSGCAFINVEDLINDIRTLLTEEGESMIAIRQERVKRSEYDSWKEFDGY